MGISMLSVTGIRSFSGMPVAALRLSFEHTQSRKHKYVHVNQSDKREFRFFVF